MKVDQKKLDILAAELRESLSTVGVIVIALEDDSNAAIASDMPDSPPPEGLMNIAAVLRDLANRMQTNARREHQKRRGN